MDLKFLKVRTAHVPLALKLPHEWTLDVQTLNVLHNTDLFAVVDLIVVL